MRILRVATEDVGREKSSTFLLIRHAILGGRQDRREASRPLHAAIVDFLQCKEEEEELTSTSSAAVSALQHVQPGEQQEHDDVAPLLLQANSHRFTLMIMNLLKKPQQSLVCLLKPTTTPRFRQQCHFGGDLSRK
jgi:hypothetical protein